MLPGHGRHGGRKQSLAAVNGSRESEESWKTVLEDLKRRYVKSGDSSTMPDFSKKIPD
ncbi:MAG: hypothetical protein ACR2IE_18975 [Candidatus Sumerlaeaceae bacterium]